VVKAIQRRDFVTLLGGAAAWPLAVYAQQRARLPRVGFLGLVPEFMPGDGLRSGLRDLGYIEGSNIVIEWRWAQKVEDLPALAAELVHMPVDVIFAPSSTFVEAARQVTTTIPIVFAVHPTQSAWGTSQVLRGRAATSPECRCCSQNWSPRDWR
jgi:hypothetical protein